MKTLLHCFFATVLVFVIIELLNLIPLNISFLDPIELAFKDFELTDIVFSKLNDNRDLRIDTNIVIVNIGQQSRHDIARQIERIEQYNPAVVAIDALFWRLDSSKQTSALFEAVTKHDNIILSSKIEYNQTNTDEDTIVSVKNAINGFDVSNVRHGYVNFSNVDGEFRTIRSWLPCTQYKDSMLTSFAWAVIQMYKQHSNTVHMQFDSTELQTINYQMKRTYMRVDVQDMSDTTQDFHFLKNKIVLMSFMGTTLSDTTNYEDSFYSPLNQRYAGKSLPDIFGVEIHANCISMSLHNDTITSWSDTTMFILSFLLCFVSILMFASIEKHFEFFYDIFSKIIQLLLSIALLTLCIWIFQKFRIKLDPTLSVGSVIISSDIYSLYNSGISAIISKLQQYRSQKQNRTKT